MSAAGGFRYLLRHTGSADVARGQQPLVNHYVESGNPQDRWIGSGPSSVAGPTQGWLDGSIDKNGNRDARIDLGLLDQEVHHSGSRRSHRVGRLGIVPRTRGLKERPDSGRHHPRKCVATVRRHVRTLVATAESD